MSTIRLTVPRKPAPKILEVMQKNMFEWYTATRSKDITPDLTGEVELEIVEVGKPGEDRLLLTEIERRFAETGKIAAGDTHRTAVIDLVSGALRRGGKHGVDEALPEEWRIKDRVLLFLGTHWDYYGKSDLVQFLSWNPDCYCFNHWPLSMSFDQPARTAVVAVRRISE